MNVLDEIRKVYDLLTKKQKTITDYILANPQDICYISLKELARNTEASEVSVLRLCKALGFESYNGMKEVFRKQTQLMLKSDNEPNYFPPEPLEDYASCEEQLLAQVSANECANLGELYGGVTPEYAFSCARAILSAEKVVIFGHEVSKIMSDFLSYRLNLLRINAVAMQLEDMGAVENCLSRLSRHDHVVIISYPPYYLPISNIARFAAQRGAAVTVITDSPSSPAITTGSHNFFCRTDTKFFHNSITTIISLINYITSAIAIEMGPKFDEIQASAGKVNRLLNSQNAEPAIPAR